jgi:peptide/nickel transport system substrate-binding protein
VVLTLLASACGGSDSGQAGEPSDEASPDEASTVPDELVLAVGGEPDEGYDPTLGWGRYGSPLFQATLLTRGADLDVTNDLATGYEVSADGLVWTVSIRDDVVFSDGTPLAASDVAYTFNTAATSGGVIDLTALDEAVAVDDTTVEFRLTSPRSTFVNRLITLGIVPEASHGEGYGRNPIGSGPYRMVRWDEGQQLIVERNPLYHGQQPAFERLVLVFLEEDAALAAAKAGEVDVASVPPALASSEVEGMTRLPVTSIDNRGILFPTRPDAGETTDAGDPIGNDVTADLAVRQAVNVAVDRAALVDGILDGYGSPAYGPVDGLPWFEPASIIEDADLEMAREILVDGGWEDSDGDGVVDKDGVPASFTLIYPASDLTRQGLAVAVADMLQSIGIDVSVDGASWDDIEHRMHAEPVVFGWGSHDQTEMYNLYHSSLAGVEFFNAGYYQSDVVDNYLDLALAAPTEEEADVLWRAAQLDDEGEGFSAPADAVWAWLVNLDHTYFLHQCLDVGDSQVEPHGHGYPITAGVLQWTWTC